MKGQGPSKKALPLRPPGLGQVLGHSCFLPALPIIPPPTKEQECLVSRSRASLLQTPLPHGSDICFSSPTPDAPPEDASTADKLSVL